MNDVNDRLIQAVRDVMFAHPAMDANRALRFALDSDAELAYDYHHAGADGAVDLGHNPPRRGKVETGPHGTVRDVEIARLQLDRPAARRHYAQLSPTERVREMRQLGFDEQQIATRMGTP